MAKVGRFLVEAAARARAHGSRIGSRSDGIISGGGGGGRGWYYREHIVGFVTGIVSRRLAEASYVQRRMDWMSAEAEKHGGGVSDAPARAQRLCSVGLRCSGFAIY